MSYTVLCIIVKALRAFKNDNVFNYFFKFIFRMITKKFSLLLVLGLTGLGIFYVTLTNKISSHSTR